MGNVSDFFNTDPFFSADFGPFGGDFGDYGFEFVPVYGQGGRGGRPNRRQRRAVRRQEQGMNAKNISFNTALNEPIALLVEEKSLGYVMKMICSDYVDKSSVGIEVHNDQLVISGMMYTETTNGADHGKTSTSNKPETTSTAGAGGETEQSGETERGGSQTSGAGGKIPVTGNAPTQQDLPSESAQQKKDAITCERCEGGKKIRFERYIILPGDVNQENICAHFEHSTWCICLPRIGGATPKKIQIATGQHGKTQTEQTSIGSQQQRDEPPTEQKTATA
jgi:hypothetical protein